MEDLLKRAEVNAQMSQSGQGHVAADAGAAVKIHKHTYSLGAVKFKNGVPSLCDIGEKYMVNMAAGS
jgi:hypothetical protein